MVKIGYQGIVGSNSEEAAIALAKQLQLVAYELIPLITSREVTTKLLSSEVDYGVMAIKNSLGGEVLETRDAIEGKQLEVVDRVVLEIHQCLFVKPGIQPEDITCIASHLQALTQTQHNRLKYYPNALSLSVPDTAIAAKYLTTGKLSDTTAVLCRRSAGELYNLQLVCANMEDRSGNYTEFQMFKLK